jgi:hypothetical protein
MGDMICSKCHKYGIYWKNLGTMNQHTYCPHCSGINCQKMEEVEKRDREKINQMQAVEIIKEELNDHTRAEILQEMLEFLGFDNYIVETEII